MIRPGPRNSLTDVEGLTVGNAEDMEIRTGVTVALADPACLAAADVRGGAPAVIGPESLLPGGLIDRVDAVFLSGGSSFGLAAQAGLMGWLAAQGRGFGEWGPKIPIVAGAILFDLLNGGAKAWGAESPYPRLAIRAAEQARADFALGNAGAGLGAEAGPYKGGLGTASAVDGLTGITVAALVAANPVGSPCMPGQPTFWAWHLEQEGELGGQPPPAAATGHAFETKRRIGQSTTIGIVATDALLGRGQLQRLAVMAQDGFTIAVRPVHSPFDGDTIFALATGRRALPAKPDALLRLGAIAAGVVARATARGVVEAQDLGAMRSWRSVWGR
jgi:L-aminopeptidase/D-esterase-like protein